MDDKHTSYFNFLDALKEQRCPVCFLYRFSNEKFGKEGDSWIRAIEKFIGKEGVF